MKISNWIWIGVVVVLVVIIGVLFFSNRSKDNELTDLAMRLSEKDSMEIIDKGTIKKQAVEIDNLAGLAKLQSQKISELMAERKQKPTVVTRIEYRTVIDSIKLPADSVFMVNGQTWGMAEKDTTWYYAKLRWSCSPVFEASIDKISFYEKLNVIEYESETEQGVYVESLNPYSVMERVHYFKKKEQDKVWRLGGGLSRELNLNFGYLLLHGSYKGHNAIIGAQVETLLNPKTFSYKNILIGYTYQFSW